MPVRVASALLIAFLVLAVAVTPLSATFQPGYFDLRLASPYGNTLGVTLEDDTGLVMALTDADSRPSSQAGMTRSLTVDWEGDSDDSGIWMHFFAIDGGYRLVETTTKYMSRSFGTGRGARFVLILRAPIDPSTVQVVNS